MKAILLEFFIRIGFQNDNDTRTLEQYLIDKSHIGVVVFDCDRWAIDFNKDTETGRILHGTHGRIDVIGNIYENQEILEP
jgi:hypothetical protein